MNKITNSLRAGPAWLLGVLLTACGGGTGEQRTVLEIEVVGAGHSVQTESGWTVTIEEAEANLGPIFFFEGEPLFSRVFRELFTIPSAYAHPGHYVEGDALAELLTVDVVDLCASEPVTLGLAQGVTGTYNSAQVGLTPASTMDGAAVRVRGVAERDGETVAFTASVPLDEGVAGIAFGPRVSEAIGRIRLAVDMSVWFDQADFTGLADGELSASSQPYRALVRGLIKTSAFVLELMGES